MHIECLLKVGTQNTTLKFFHPNFQICYSDNQFYYVTNLWQQIQYFLVVLKTFRTKYARLSLTVKANNNLLTSCLQITVLSVT